MTVYISKETQDLELTHYGVKGMKWRKHLKAKSQDGLADFVKTYKEYQMNMPLTIGHYAKKGYNRYLKKPLQSTAREARNVGKDIIDTLFGQLEGPWRKRR